MAPSVADSNAAERVTSDMATGSLWHIIWEERVVIGFLPWLPLSELRIEED